MIQFEKLGIFLSKPVAFLLVTIYLVQSMLLIYLVQDKFELEKQVTFQQKRIDELEEKLQIYNAIKDFQIGFNEEEIGKLTNVVYEESIKYPYDPMFVLAIILTESSFKKGQKSHVGARGLMQVVPFVGKDLADRSGIEWNGSETLYDVETNIKLGTLHLFEQILEFGDIQKALAAYNMGSTRVRGLLRKNSELPDKYIKKVIENYNMLKEKYSV